MKSVAFIGLIAVIAAAVAATAAAGVPVLVMLQLDAINNDGSVNNPNQLKSDFAALKNAGVEGVMGDVWWGICETSPQVYNFTGYQELVQLVQDAGLKYQAVMSLHQCGGNVGDACNIPLPSFVHDAYNAGHDIFYTDREGNVDQEYISLFWDEESVFGGRTPIDMYTDYMQAWSKAMAKFIADGTVVQVEISMGPAGEMRYPSYRADWNFCGIGEFQCYDSGALDSLKAAATAIGQPSWGQSGPDNAGNYNSHLPFTVGFWSGNEDQNNYSSAYGRFFLNWYFESLLSHGERVLAAAQSVFKPLGLPIMGKVAGIHWWYKSPEHAAECTAGYYNTNGVNAYGKIADMFAQYNAGFDFTCFEMTDNEPGYAQCDSGPYELVEQAKAASHAASISFSGENALPIYNSYSYGIIEQQSTNLGYLIDSFTYLRLGPTLMQGGNLNTFSQFVRTMNGLSG